MTRSEFDAIMKKHNLVVGEGAWKVSKIIADELQQKYISLVEAHAKDAVDDYGQRHLNWLAAEMRNI
jgi:hypothetical protein